MSERGTTMSATWRPEGDDDFASEDLNSFLGYLEHLGLSLLLPLETKHHFREKSWGDGRISKRPSIF